MAKKVVRFTVTTKKVVRKLKKNSYPSGGCSFMLAPTLLE